MTCIVGMIDKEKNIVVMGADSCGSNGSFNAKRKDTKMFKKGKFLFGCTSSFRMIQILMYKFNPPDINGKELHDYLCTDFIDGIRKCFEENGFMQEYTNKQIKGGTFLVAYENRLFQIDDDYQVGENSCGYGACGSGDVYAYGCLFGLTDIDMSVEGKVLTALMSAEEYSATVASPFSIMTTHYGNNSN